MLDLPAGLDDRMAARCILDRAYGIRVCRLCDRHVSPPQASPKHVFSQDALTALYHAALGNPRKLNRLADLALLIAYAQDRPIVDDVDRPYQPPASFIATQHDSNVDHRQRHFLGLSDFPNLSILPHQLSPLNLDRIRLTKSASIG